MKDNDFAEAIAEYTHTPGPWMIFHGGDIGSAAVRLPETIVLKAGSIKGATIGEACQNAKLIAAAPELLELCQHIMEYMDNGTPLHPGALLVDDLRAAIAEATGK
jgi:hypothetical protein